LRNTRRSVPPTQENTLNSEAKDLRADMKFKVVLSLFTFLIGTSVHGQIDQSLCEQCLAIAKEELRKCLIEAISQEDKKSCQGKQETRLKTCENGECKIEKAAESGNKSEAVPAKK
jgi:hypothetical protein